MNPTERRTYPRLRVDLDLVPVQNPDGTAVIVVRDPLDLGGQGPVGLRPETLGILALLDGSRSLEEVRRHLLEDSAQQGQPVSLPLEALQSFLGQLDQFFLLENERTQLARQQQVEQFQAAGERPAVLAGRSYPEERQALGQFLEELLGQDPLPMERAAKLAEREPLALVAPHIELQVGAAVYGAAYNRLRGRSYDRVIVLGVGHNLIEGLFCFTDKDFTTPLGGIPTDRLAVARLRKAAGPLAAPHDFAHRQEHSIEFQLVLLQQVLAGPFTIVPVLVGSLHEPLVEQGQPRPAGALPGLEELLELLARMLADRSRRTLLVAGVDFCHIGPKFGDRMTAKRLEEGAARHDRMLLATLCTGQVEAFCRESRQARDRYHVCGLSTLALLLEVLERVGAVEGVELDRRIWHEEATRSAVSFAAAAFYRR